MRATYQEITDKMRAAFFDACGEKPEDLPELDARFRSVATELYALSVFGDHVQSQVFADTARGADLDRHAADVGLQRKGASAAAGVLTFSLAQAAEAAVTVPADTVCSVPGSPICSLPPPRRLPFLPENGRWMCRPFLWARPLPITWSRGALP